MHEDELPTDAALVRRLLAAQFPEWAELPIDPLASSGTVKFCRSSDPKNSPKKLFVKSAPSTFNAR